MTALPPRSSFPFGPGSLDSHCQTFLGIRKSEAITQEDKSHMRRTFCEKSNDAYGYALTDPVNTLLVWEQMQQCHVQVYQGFGFSPNDTPPMRGTLGAGVSDLVTRTAQQSTVNSQKLESGRSCRTSGALLSRSRHT